MAVVLLADDHELGLGGLSEVVEGGEERIVRSNGRGGALDIAGDDQVCDAFFGDDSADVGGIPPEGGIEAAYKRQLAEAEDPKALRAEIEARIESARGPVGPLSKFQIEEMIDPRDTRRLICEWVETAYQVVSEPAGLVPRALQFRP